MISEAMFRRKVVTLNACIRKKRNDLKQKLKGIKIDEEETIFASGNIIMVVENTKK